MGAATSQDQAGGREWNTKGFFESTPLVFENSSRPWLYVHVLIVSKPGDGELARNAGGMLSTVSCIGGFPMFRSFGTKLVIQSITDDQIAAKLADEFPNKMIKQLGEMGIVAEVDPVFRMGSFTVLRTSFVSCDLDKMAAAKLGRETQNGNFFMGTSTSTAASSFGIQETFSTRSDAVAGKKIVETLCDTLPQVLPEKVAYKGLVVEVVAKPEDDEALYFFRTHKALEQAMRQQQSQNSALNFRSCFSGERVCQLMPFLQTKEVKDHGKVLKDDRTEPKDDPFLQAS